MSTDRAKKRFGQHFLCDAQIIQHIVESFQLEPAQIVLEIGPGRGALTYPLLQSQHTLYAVELDRDLIAKLKQESTQYGELILIEQDVLRFQLSSLPVPLPICLVGNLPYNISTPLLFHLSQQQTAITSMHFMLQKEVADRLCAQPSCKQYGRLSIMMQADWEIESLFDVSPDAFVPPPKVHSSIVRFFPRTDPIAPHCRDAFSQVVLSAFQLRRKTLRNALKQYLSVAEIEQLNIDPGVRAETLDLRQYERLAEQLQKKLSDDD